MRCQAGPSDVFVIDMDGVLLDKGAGSDTLQAVASSSFPIYFVSNLAPEQAAALLHERCGLPDLAPDSPRLYAGLVGGEQKLDALRRISERPVCQEPGTSLHFVDDSFGLLRQAREDPALGGRWALYLTDWGACTLAERLAAQSTRGVRLVTSLQLREVLKWGLLQGVDDGCQEAYEGAAPGGSATLVGVNG